MRSPGLGASVRLALLVALVVAGIVGAQVIGVPEPDTLREEAARTGVAGLAAFVVGYVACTLLVLPKGVLSIAAGLTWGLTTGVALVLVGAVIGAILAFWIGRWLGRDAVTRLGGAHMAQLDALVERRGVLAVVIVRLIPLIPFTVINYASGLTAVRFGSYVLGTAVGIVPGTVAYVALGAYGADPGTWEFALAVGAFALLTVVGAVAARRHRSTGAAPRTLVD